MRKDLITFKKINSSFLSCDQDISITLELLFSNTNPYSEYLRRLLFINNPDCLKGKTNQIEQKYKKIMSSKVNLAYLEDNDYIRQNPDDKNINKIIDEFIDYLSIGISNLVNIFEPEAIGIGGSFVYFSDVLLEKLKNNIIKNSQ